MSTLTGFIESSEPGRVRVYPADRPKRFHEVGRDDVIGFDQTGDELIGVVRLAEEATIATGELDDTAYQALFLNEGRPADNSPFYRETSFKQCYSWNPPGGGGYC